MEGPNLLSLAFLVLVISNIVASHKIITSLPGFDGDLPFKLETGYIGVGEMDDVQLFYYFVESERSPGDDPLVLWLTGGPGCSAFSGLVYEIGPLSFDLENSRSNPANLLLNPYSWTKVANIIFLDAPVGTGFSYANSWQGYNINDTLSTQQIYCFLRKWLRAHPFFLVNSLYIAGDSYSGKIVPMVVQEISDGIDVGNEPKMNLKGYAIGNPLTDRNIDINSRIFFSYLKALITLEIYEVNSPQIYKHVSCKLCACNAHFQSAKRNCNGDYLNVDPSNGLCKADLQNITACIGKICMGNILESACSLVSQRAKHLNWDRRIMDEEEDSMDFLSSPTQTVPKFWCRRLNYISSQEWANDNTVQTALGIRKGTIKEWVRCNKSMSYTEDVPTSLVYHRNLVKKGYQVLVYSGDHDLVIPYVGTETWIKSLNLTIESGWQPWFVDGQVAGYWMQYAQKNYHLTFATVKGGGHTAPEYKPRECLAMITRWFAYYPL